VLRDKPLLAAESLSGAWAVGIDGTKTDIELRGRMDVPAAGAAGIVDLDSSFQENPLFERLLASQRETIVGRITWPDAFEENTTAPGSQLLFVVNGSFLLNLPLVNHEHRKLAQRLITACGPPGRTVFLESGEGGPQVFASEPGVSAPTGFEVFTVWPLGVILVHLTALGFLACIAFFPVFGRPRQLPARPSSDFGQHVEALGELIEETGDREFAWQKLRSYQEQIRGEPASSRHHETVAQAARGNA
jgi:hypothetical protein